MTLEPGLEVGDAVAAFARMPEVEYAEPNGIVRRTQGTTFKPDDRYYQYQWNLTQVNAERTWGIQKGQSSVAVAVLDSGVAYEDYTDPRTRQVFRKAPDWGDTRFLPGYDFVNDDAHPNDDEYHGTHVASTIAEATNNGLGVAGLAFGCALMPIKVLDQDGEGTFFDVAEGIDYATTYAEGGTRPVKVINMSLGTESFSQTVKAAVDRATAAGVLVVAAAGNSAKGIVEFPANLSNVLAVGALDARKEKAPYSNSGADLDFVAPGGNCDRDDNADGFGDCVFQQMPDPDFVELGRHDQFCYCGLDGTSMATPHVAAAAALLFSQGFTDAAAVRAALEQDGRAARRRTRRGPERHLRERPRPARGGAPRARPRHRPEEVGRPEMTSRMSNLLATPALLALLAVPSTAGELAVEGQGGYFEMAAKDSATALFGSTGGGTFGGAVRYTFWRGAFASAGFRTFSKDGQRVFVASSTGPVQELGFPLSIKIDSFPIVVGYRFRDGHLVVPYVAAGAAVTKYQETSEVAGESFDESLTRTGFTGAAGVEIGRGLFRFGAELGYTTVASAIGVGGVSKVYGEDDIGGFHAVGKLVLAFGMRGSPH